MSSSEGNEDRSGTRVCIGAIGGTLCTVKALMEYLATRRVEGGPTVSV